MTYDATHHRTLALAGDAMWAFDGGTRRWTKLPSGANPPRLYGGTIAYDAARGNVVYFGSTTNPVLCDPLEVDQTWIFDGTTWTQVHPAHAPDGCFGYFEPQSTYDVARRRVVVVGVDQQLDQGRVWEWDGVDWSNLLRAAGFAGEAAAYDQRSHRVIIFGGTFFFLGLWLDQGGTAAWDGASWSALAPGGRSRDPHPRAYAAMMYDPFVGAPVLFGGQSRRPETGAVTSYNDTWRWTGTHWVQMGTRHLPPPTTGALVYDTDHGFGVFSNDAQTWLFTAAAAGNGYFIGERDGTVVGLGDAHNVGDAHTIRLNQPIVGLARTVTRNGYWLAASDGGIFAFGDARFYGSTGNIRLNQPIVGIAPTPSGRGYWLVARDGGIFAFGDALFAGSAANIKLNQPIVGMASTPTGDGYWLVARDGGIFAFGDARFYGSTGNIRLNQPVVGMAAMPRGDGYWLVGRDGGIFNYGHAPFAGTRLSATPVVAIAPSPTGAGYWTFDNTGHVATFGDARNYGSVNATQLRAPIINATPT